MVEPDTCRTCGSEINSKLGYCWSCAHRGHRVDSGPVESEAQKELRKVRQRSKK